MAGRFWRFHFSRPNGIIFAPVAASEAIVRLQISKNNFCLVPEIRFRQCRTFVNQKISRHANQGGVPWEGYHGGEMGTGKGGMGNGRGGGEAGKGGRGKGGWVGDLPILKYFRLECLQTQRLAFIK